MKSLRLLAIALLACATTASAEIACDAHKNSTTTASVTKLTSKSPAAHASGCCADEATKSAKFATATAATAAKGTAACTAEMAAQCTPAMRAACEQNAAVASAMGCNTKGSTSASFAGHAKSAKGATMASGAACSMYGSKTATVNMDHCAAAKGANFTASSTGKQCSAHVNAAAHDCSACEDWVNCEQDVRAVGAKAQVVSLKNGVMIVYTADSPSGVKALQTAVSKRNEQMMVALSAGSDKKLCDECKHLRGAIASGKLHREIVNVERGCMTLITSNDRGVVQKIRTMTGQPVAMR